MNKILYSKRGGNMIKKIILIILLLVIYSYSLIPQVFSISTVYAQSEFEKIPQTMIIELEKQYEKEKTEYIQNNILDKILGPEEATALVDVTLRASYNTGYSQSQKKNVQRTRKLADIDYILPGIPNPKSVSQGESAPQDASVEATRSEAGEVDSAIVIKKLIVTIIYNNSLDKDKIAVVQDAIVATLSMDLAKKDIYRLDLRPVKYDKAFLSKFFGAFVLLLQPKYFLPLLLALLLSMFLFGPLSKFLGSYINALKERPATEITVDSKQENMASSAAEKTEEEKAAEKAEEANKLAEGKYLPFSYITEENVNRLVYLIAKEPPEIIAMVLNYLKPEFIRAVLSKLSARLQAEVAMCMAQPKTMTQDEVVKIDSYVKERIDFSVGGIEQLLMLLDEVDKNSRDNILEYLRNEKPDFYEKVRKSIFLFEDIPSVTDIALQTAIREMKIENISRALINVDETIANKFLTNMSEGARALVKEEMEYNKSLSPDQIAMEQEKLVDTIKKLEREGRISIREKRDMMSEGVDDGYISDGTSNIDKSLQNKEQQAEEYYNYGMNLVNEGKNEESIQYFQYCIELNPDYWPAYQCLGNAYYALQNYTESLKNYEKTVKLHPEDRELAQWVKELKSSLTTA